jgi:hypothetical protein
MQKTLSNPVREFRINRPSAASYVLFATGVVSYFLGAVLLLWEFKTIKGQAALPNWLFDKSLLFLFLTLFCWVLAPFFTKRPLWMKIGLSAGLVFVWWLMGGLFASVAAHVAVLSNL